MFHAPSRADFLLIEVERHSPINRVAQKGHVLVTDPRQVGKRIAYGVTGDGLGVSVSRYQVGHFLLRRVEIARLVTAVQVDIP